jgi:trans-aconitate 2-methyltransferase
MTASTSGGAAPGWDPGQYLRYADERGRPFADLLARIPVADARTVVDLGCGPGTLTRGLIDIWPQAVIIGVDSSADMIDAAAEHEVTGRLDFVQGDAQDWQPAGPVDVVIANAVLHWVPGHLGLIGRIAQWLTPGGVFAFQVPDNFTFPSHLVIRDLRLSAKWRDRLGAGADRQAGVESAEAYLGAMLEAGLDPDVWSTTYLHVLTGDDAVLEWVKGTALRPVLTALADDPEASADFLAECGEQLRAAYPPGPHGTVFPFRRIFAIGRAGSR